MAEPPYKYIYQQLMKGEVIPFLGAGVPLYDRNPKVTSWLSAAPPGAIAHLPTASELAADLHGLSGLPPTEIGELTRMAQYFKYAAGSDPLHKRLLEVFSFEQDPTPVHKFLAEVPAPLLIVTTNYDDLMERALDAEGKKYHVMVYSTESDQVLWWKPGAPSPESSPSEEIDLTGPPCTVLYKMHGAIDRRPGQKGQYVITEDDYIQFLNRMTRTKVVPIALAEAFHDRPFLFLGYGLYDWNLRVILGAIQAQRRKFSVKSWAIETLPKEIEQKLWQERDVTMYDSLSLKDFLDKLKAQGTVAAGAAGAPTPPGPAGPSGPNP